MDSTNEREGSDADVVIEALDASPHDFGLSRASDFSAAGFRERVRDHLQGQSGVAGDHVLNTTLFPEASQRVLRDAAVLITAADRGSQASVLLTQRTDHLSSHAGQIAFPGGKIDAGDHDATDAALREASEEIGLASDFVEPIGRLVPYLTRSGFRIVPVLGVVRGIHAAPGTGGRSRISSRFLCRF